MNLNQLNIFYAVATKKSFSLAAKSLFLTQPAVTMQLQLLEDYLGIQLIERVGKRMELTDAGRVLLSFAKKILALFQEAESVIADFKGLSRGTLRIGTTNTVAKYYFPEILSSFSKKYPNIKINLKAGNSQEAVDRILNFETDICLVGRVSYGDKLSIIPFSKDKVVLVVSPKNDLCEQKKIDLGELKGKPIIIRETGSALRELTLEAFKRAEISPNIIMELGDCDAIKTLVGHGIGLSFLSLTMVREEVKKGILRAIDISDADLTLHNDIVYHKNRASSHLIRTFINNTLESFQAVEKSANPSRR